MVQAKRIAGRAAGMVTFGAAAFTGRYYMGRGRANEIWNTSNFLKLNRLGSVDRLSVLPLIDYYAAGEDLATEPGVSYLVRAGDVRRLRVAQARHAQGRNAQERNAQEEEPE